MPAPVHSFGDGLAVFAETTQRREYPVTVILSGGCKRLPIRLTPAAAKKLAAAIFLALNHDHEETTASPEPSPRASLEPN